MTTSAPDISSLLDQLREQWLEVVKEREELREALRAALNSLSRTVRKSYPNYPEEQMQISPTMTVADARAILSNQKGTTSMKPTGATKDDDSWIDKLLDTVAHAQDLDRRVAARLQIKNAVNERERLREALRAALRIVVDRAAGGRMLTTQAEAKEVARLCADALSQPATTSTSAGGG